MLGGTLYSHAGDANLHCAHRKRSALAAVYGRYVFQDATVKALVASEFLDIVRNEKLVWVSVDWHGFVDNASSHARMMNLLHYKAANSVRSDVHRLMS